VLKEEVKDVRKRMRSTNTSKSVGGINKDHNEKVMNGGKS
jgi:hypothetical protein